jgi:hypothetical protein
MSLIGPTGSAGISITGPTGFAGIPITGPTSIPITGFAGVSITGPTGSAGIPITGPAGLGNVGEMASFITDVGYKNYSLSSNNGSLSGPMLGYYAGAVNRRTGCGIQSNYRISGGSSEQSIGRNTLYNYAGSKEISAYGSYAFHMITSVDPTDIGSNALAVGFRAGSNYLSNELTTVTGSRFIGANAKSTNGYSSNEIIIGYNAASDGNMGIVLGNTSITSLYCNSSITSISDIRDKKNISKFNDNALDIIDKIEPIAYTWLPRDTTNTKRNKEYGFSAQNLINVRNSSQIADYLDITNESDPNFLKIKPNNLIPVVVQAIKELSVMIDKLNADLNDKLNDELII